MYKLESYLLEHRIKFNLPSPIQQIMDERIDNQGVSLYVKREDKIGNELTGNKYRKLILNIQFLLENEYQSVSTYGGAFSNHIHAVAAAGKLFNFKTKGIIRGEEPKQWSPTLKFAKAHGMELRFINRNTYTAKNFHLSLENSDHHYLIPEGGTNALAIKGCQEIVNEAQAQLAEQINYWMVCCGTGGTAAGIISALNNASKVVAFQILKGEGMGNDIENLLSDNQLGTFNKWEINQDYHFGGYAKLNQALIDFMNDFKSRHGIQLDPIYTGKMMFGIYDLVGKGAIPRGSKIVAVHTGGLQGVDGFNMRFGDLLL